MREHVINIQLRISARDSISRLDIMRDLRRQLTMLQEQSPYRGTEGAGWWTNSNSAVAMLKFNSIGEQAGYEAEVREEDAQRAEADAPEAMVCGACRTPVHRVRPAGWRHDTAAAADRCRTAGNGGPVEPATAHA